MTEVISKIVKIEVETLPFETQQIESKILKNGIEPLRWAIVDVDDKKLTISVSGRVVN